MMELIEVQHCHENVRLTNVQDFNSKALFSRTNFIQLIDAYLYTPFPLETK